MATAKAKRKPVEVESSAHDRSKEILSLVSELDQTVKINAITFGTEARTHTGLLCMDLMMGGGISPGMFTWVGPEQSAKTTLAIQMIAASVDQRVDLRVLWDAEGSTSSATDYVANIFETVGVKKATAETVFGVRDGNGNWDIPPLVHIKDDYEGVKFFDWMHALQKRLPDKRFENGSWWYVYDDSKDITKVKARLDKLGLEVDKKMSANNAGLWVPAEDGRLQAIVILDSWVSLVPPSMDEDEADNSIAVQARFFSKQLPRIKGALRAKRIAILGINQLRLNPMQRFGNPETEPGGQALKFWSDCRLRTYGNAASAAPFPVKSEDGRHEREPSVTGEGEDIYRYISVKTIKNKLSIPNRSTWLRLWVQDSEGQARGYDPVYDCLAGDTLVATDKGSLRLEDIQSFTSQEKTPGVYSVENLKAIGHDGKYHAVVSWACKGIKEVFTLRTRDGREIRASAKHQFQVLTTNGELCWRPVKDLDGSEYLVVGANFSRKGTSQTASSTYSRIQEGRGNNQFALHGMDLTLDEDLAYLLGYLITDGTYSPRESRWYTSEESNAVHLSSLIEKITGIAPRVYEGMGGSEQTVKTPYVLVLSNVDFGSVLANLGMTKQTSKDKHVPAAIFQSTPTVVKAFLRGVLAGDGSIANGDQVLYSSASQTLLSQISYLLWGLGIENQSGRIHGYAAQKYKEIVGVCPTKVFMNYDAPVVEGTPKNFFHKLPVPVPKAGYNFTVASVEKWKAEKPMAATLATAIQPVLDAGFGFSAIQSIEPSGYEEVFDIEVEGAHSFLANGVVAHNCFYYLYQTGQLEVPKRSTMRLKIDGMDPAQKAINWMEFKTLILGTKEQQAPIWSKMGLRPVNIRRGCANQTRKGRAEDLFINEVKSRLNAEKSKTKADAED